MAKIKNHPPPVLTRESSQDFKAWPHLRILYVLADNFVYFKENRVNKFKIQELADKCGVGRLQVSKSLKYLRNNHYLITIIDEEFVNPLYCYQCGQEVLKELIRYIVDENVLYTDGKRVIKPSYRPAAYLNFKNIEPAH